MRQEYWCTDFDLSLIATDSAKRLENLNCKPRATVVPTDVTEALYYPYFVSLDRCNGSWGTHSPAVFECVPDQTKQVPITVRMDELQKTIFLVSHTSCKRQCVHKKEDCRFPATYDAKHCTCGCNHASAPANMQCGKHQRYSFVYRVLFYF